jgi:hypothetical protein
MINLSKRALVLLGIAYLAPLVVYVVTFGVTLSSEHTTWAEFGSAMSGIYGPIIALSTLAVLIVQAGLQRQLNDHEFRQSHISQARQDIEFYANQLTMSLEKKPIPGKTFRSVLHANFQPPGIGELDSENLRALAADVDDGSLGIVSIWSGVYSVVAGLSRLLKYFHKAPRPPLEVDHFQRGV